MFRLRVLHVCLYVLFVVCQEVELIAVKTKGGMRFVTPSGKKSSLTGVTGRSVSMMATKPASRVQPQPAVTRTTTTTTSITTAAAAARGNKQSAVVAPTSQLAKVMILSISTSLL